MQGKTALITGITGQDGAYLAEFIYQNLMIQTNLIHEAWRAGVQKPLFLGSSCIYPRDCPQPIKEEYLLIGPLEPTNEPYAIAKIAGIKLCESYNRQYGTDYRSVMPCNLYGSGDNYHPQNSHVIPALIRRIHEAKTTGADNITVWGSGKALREFLYVDDMAAACLHLMELDQASFVAQVPTMQSHVNIGSGQEISIGKLAKLIVKVVGFQGGIQYDHSIPDGTPRKQLFTYRLNALGFNKKLMGLEEGLAKAYEDFKANLDRKAAN
jgi:GDP-L-fucose synthase